MPDDPKPTDESTEKPEEQGVPTSQVSSLVDTFKDTIREIRAEQAAAKPAPPAGPSQEEKLAAYEKAKKEANEMAASGEVAEAVEHLQQTWTKLTAGDAPATDDHPAYKGLVKQAEKIVSGDHKEMFDAYGDEIRNVVMDKPADARLNPDVWEAAVREVKAAHIDEILDQERQKRIEAEKARLEEESTAARGAARVAGGSRGRRPAAASGGSDVELDSEQLEFAQRINFTPERYAAAVKSYDENLEGQGSVRLLDDDGDNIKPGKF